MISWVYKHFNRFNLFYFKQVGFRKKFASKDALAELTETIRTGLKNNLSSSFFVDLRKAFDTLDQ